jgi:hypothetical protein
MPTPEHIFEFSQLNPLKMYQQSQIETNEDLNLLLDVKIFDSKYNNHHIDEDFYSKYVNKEDTFFKYLIPFQTTEKIVLQFLGIFDAEGWQYTANIIDLFGNYIVNVPVIYGPVVANSTKKIYSVDFPLGTINEGCYAIQIVYDNGLFHSQKIISEPFSVKKYRDNTKLFEYTNDRNIQDIFFDASPGLKFQLRLNCILTELNTKNKAFNYEDENYNLTTLSSVVFRNWVLEFGKFGEYLPEYMADKIERIFGCKDVQIDGVYYSKPEGSNMDAKRIVGITACTYTLDIREKENNTILQTPYYPLILIAGGTIPTSYRFFITSLYSSVLSQIIDINMWFGSQAEFLAYINSLNISTGKFGINKDNYLVLQCKEYADYSFWLYDWAMQNNMPFCIEIEFVGNYNPTQYVNIDNTTSGNYILAAFCLDKVKSSTPITEAGGATSYPFPTIGLTDKNTICYLFMGKNIDTFAIDYSSGNISVNTLYGNLPANFIFTNFYNWRLNTIKNNIFLTCNGLLNENDFRLNNFTSLEVDKIIMYLKDAQDANCLANYSSNTIGSINPAPPSKSLSMRKLIQLMRSQNVNINHD